MAELYFLSNIVLIVSCFLLAGVFRFIPMPDDEGLSNYRSTLKVLIYSYSIVGLFLIIEIFSGELTVDFISSIYLGICSSQALLFYILLISLYDTEQFPTRALKHWLIPLIVFLLLHVIFVPAFGYPLLSNLSVWRDYLFHPTVVLRSLFFVFYLLQTVVYINNIIKKDKQFRMKLDNYTSEHSKRHLQWVRYAFLVVAIVNVSTLLATFFPSMLNAFSLNVLITVFYIYFAFNYLQYPSLFKEIKPLFESAVVRDQQQDDAPSINNWEDLKEEIHENKMYLTPGITIEDIARKFCVSRTVLSGYINNQEGVNFNQFINNLRVAEAKKIMYQNPSYPLLKIAEMVGYSEQSNFSRQFKLSTTVSPTQWRQKQQSVIN